LLGTTTFLSRSIQQQQQQPPKHPYLPWLRSLTDPVAALAARAHLSISSFLYYIDIYNGRPPIRSELHPHLHMPNPWSKRFSADYASRAPLNIPQQSVY
jgi:hypothetical protein